MAHNLFIAYDLMEPGQNYDAVRDRIKSLGQWHQFQFSLFYVNTQYTAAQAYDRIIATMDRNDRLAVIDAQSGVVSNYTKPLLDAINAIWTKP